MLKKYKKHLIALALVDFVALSLYLVWDLGAAAFFTSAMTNGWTMQVTLDLVIACTLFSIWMFNDAKARGISAVPFFLLIVCTGSIGALGYLLRREFGPAPVVEARSATQLA